MNNEVKPINKHQTFIIPEGYQKIPYHYVSDAKFDTRKEIICH